jgi:hypothetical protein
MFLHVPVRRAAAMSEDILVHVTIKAILDGNISSLIVLAVLALAAFVVFFILNFLLFSIIGVVVRARMRQLRRPHAPSFEPSEQSFRELTFDLSYLVARGQLFAAPAGILGGLLVAWALGEHAFCWAAVICAGLVVTTVTVWGVITAYRAYTTGCLFD